MTRGIGLSFMCAVFLAGCASAPSALQFQNQPALPAQPNKALVYFYRESNNLGCAVDLTLTDGQSEIGALQNGSYLAVYVSPGPHTFVPAMTFVKSKNTTAYAADFEASQTYYLSAQIFEVPGAEFMTYHGSGLKIDAVASSAALGQMVGLVRAGDGNGSLARCLTDF